MRFLVLITAVLTVASCSPVVVTSKKTTSTQKVTVKVTTKTTSHTTLKTTSTSKKTTTTSTKPTTTTKSTTTTKPATTTKPTTTSKTTTTTSTTTSSPTSSSTTSSTTTSTPTSTTTSTTTSSTTSSSSSIARTCTSTASLTPQPTGQPLSISVAGMGSTIESDPSFRYNYGRDGGGGGTVNGNQIIIFSDTLVNGFGPITNTMIYYTMNGSVMAQDFGNGGIPNQAIPYIANESAYTQAANGQSRVAIWPTTAIVTIPGDDMHAIGVAGVSIQSSWTSGLPSYDLYNTLFTVTAGTTPTISRTVPVLFTNSSVNYGNFGTLMNPLDNLLYFFSADGSSGLKVARASTTSYTQTSAWTFWNGATWQSQPLTPGSSGNLLDGPFSSGDVFYSPKYQTFMAVYFLANVDSTFRYRYVLPDANGNVTITGPWSSEFILYDTSALINGGYGFNYAGHAYPQNDPCGNNLTLSITLSDGVTPYFFEAAMS